MHGRPIFGLVHGAAHGAWSWQRVIGALDALGYESIAMDLPTADETAGARRYADVVADAVSPVGEELVLVGHSLGGVTIPLVASERPVRKLIFVAGVLPVPGKSLMEQRGEETDMIFPNPLGEAAFRTRYYGEATDADAAWALNQLRPQAQLPYDETTPLTTWPQVASASIVPTHDRTVNPAWSIRAARKRLGVDARLMQAADHSPFLSRPAELARLLIELAD
jgi:pimeloyl-ACP methyl ester carboxylesterase